MLLFIFLAFVFHCVAMIKRRKKEVVGENLKKDACFIKTQLSNTTNPPTQVAKLVDSCVDIEAGEYKTKQSRSNTVDFIVFAILLILFLLYVAVYVSLYKN